MSYRALLAALAAASASTAVLAATPSPPAKLAATSELDGLKYRLVGPFRGGRATGVTGVAGDPTTFYFGAAAGGLWKTTDAGTTWKPLWDNFPEAAPAVGAVAVARSNPNIVYAGTGEINIRGDVLTGNGLYKSTDAGKTWRYSGLRKSRAIGRIVVDPKNPDIVFVAALGDIFGENPERGVFKSADGGATWKKVLYVDPKTGASDVAIDPSNPNVLYAGMWQAYRKPWIMESGGPGSGLYKSVDGGETWIHLSGGGLPEGIYGRVNVAPTGDPKRVYAMIEAKRGGLYRSDDAGKTWALINDKNDYRQRAWYFNTVFADPKSPDTVWVLNTGLYKSTNAGKTFKTLHPRHGDNHELWLDPTDPRHMIEGNDGGANVSLDGGETFSTELNQPTAQFYHVSADTQFPFHLLGAQQDNTTVDIATAGVSGGVSVADWYEVGGGESGYVVPDPIDPDIVYAGGYDAEITRFDHRTDTSRQITPWPRNVMGWAPKDLEHRFQWTAPILVSRHAPHTLYFGSEALYRSLDQGASWTIISPDLTRNDKSKQISSGGPLTKDNTSVETFDTIFSIAESPLQEGLLWTGSDDGLIHLTHDAGAHWADVTPKEMPEFATVDMVEAGPDAPGVAYVAADRHRLDDFKPYAFRTTDFGKNWTSITDGLPENAYVHVVRADPVRKGLLYAGTEMGIYISFDDGAHWRALRLNMPVTPVHDLVVHGDSLAVATHGRSFWVIDDLGPLRQWSAAALADKVHLFRPSVANHTSFGGHANSEGDPSAPNPPAGAQIFYTLAARVGTPRPAPGAKSDEEKKDDDAKGEGEAHEHKAAKPDPWASRLKIEILDAGGHVVRTFPTPKVGADDKADEDEDDGPHAPHVVKLSHLAGLNTFAWDLRYESALAIPHSPLWAGSVAGPKAVPGEYQVRLSLDGATQTQPLEIVPDPREPTTPEQYRRQFELQAAIDAELTTVNQAVLDIRAARTKVDAAMKAAVGKPDAPQVNAAGEALDRKMTAVEEILIQPRAHASEDALNFPIQLNNMLAALASLVGSGDHPPTQQDEAMFVELKGKSDQQLATWNSIKVNDLPSFNKLTKG